MDFKKDYYKILEVNKNATKEEIRASFRRLVKLYHPDKNPDNRDAEENIKLVNEAHEILGNDILRHEYDEYIKKLEEWKVKQKTTTAISNINSKHKNTYKRKKSITKEYRLYVSGEIIIKYYADKEDLFQKNSFYETCYRIVPTEANVLINAVNIHPTHHIPINYNKSFEESQIFVPPIPQPTKCVVRTDSSEEYYELDLKDTRIKNIRLEGVTKHENQNLGTLRGDIYAYCSRLETYEEEEEITECSGETGKIETKTEERHSFYRKEYYNPDCTTYWGPWYIVKKVNPVIKNNVETYTFKDLEDDHSIPWAWIALLVLIVALFPRLFVTILIIAGIRLFIPFIISAISIFGRLLSMLAAVLFIVFAIAAIHAPSDKNIALIKKTTLSYDSLNSTIETAKTDPARLNKNDTLISHFIRWKDYDNHMYETKLSVLLPDVASSIVNHNNIPSALVTNSLSPVYSLMLQKDDNKLRYVYYAFDSIKAKDNLDEMSFAKMLVSCIQSIPYYLVLEGSCNIAYADEYVNNYLSSCTRDCCIGNEKYGVRSPVEFLQDLKGDCDTKALFLYGLLKHYNYNVALITSQYYKHAMIAVNLPLYEKNNATTMNIHGKNYYLWETTSTGSPIGEIAINLQNINYWDIALLNEIK